MYSKSSGKDKKLKRFLVLLTLIASCLTVSVGLSTIGNGTLYVYTDPHYTNEAPISEGHNRMYLVVLNQTIYIQIANITEFGEGETLIVKVGWEDHAKTFNGVQVSRFTSPTEHDGWLGINVAWTVGDFDDGYLDIPYSETLTVHYKDIDGREYVASGLMSRVGHIFVVPEAPLGTMAFLVAPLAALGVLLFVGRSARTRDKQHKL